jgi:hypothetical protein
MVSHVNSRRADQLHYELGAMRSGQASASSANLPTGKFDRFNGHIFVMLTSYIAEPLVFFVPVRVS